MGVIRHPDQRVAVIIDTQNLYHSAKNLYKAKVNFANVVAKAVQDRKLIRAMSYVVNTEGGEESAFFEALEKVGIEIKTKDLQIFYGGAKKADWDVGMVVDAIKLAHKVDAIIFATGDGDFIPGVEYIQNMGCQVEAITFGRSASSALRAAVDDFIDLDEDPKHYLLGYRGGGRRMNTHKPEVKTEKTEPATAKKESEPKKATKKPAARKPRARNTRKKTSTSAPVNKVVGTDTDYLD